NYPNPFNPTTKIHYKIPENTKVKLTVYNLLGQEVKILVNNLQQAGNYEVDLNFNGMSSGLYFYTLETDNFRDTKKMMLVK
ncbi:MAG TPA: peptidase S8, partial [Bacteroidetes bacterium]|nr:peptidase S8 [Bacteroidota bacterium]